MGIFMLFYALPVQETAAKIASSPVLTTYTPRFILQSLYSGLRNMALLGAISQQNMWHLAGSGEKHLATVDNIPVQAMQVVVTIEELNLLKRGCTVTVATDGRVHCEECV